MQQCFESHSLKAILDLNRKMSWSLRLQFEMQLIKTHFKNDKLVICSNISTNDLEAFNRNIQLSEIEAWLLKVVEAE